MKACERCGWTDPTPKSFALLDYCANCSADLCDRCMAAGCCGVVPAASESEEDAEEEDP